MIIISRHINPPNLISTLGLLASIASLHTSVTAQFSATLMLLIVAGVCDLLDGMVARKMSRTELEKKFGAELDSLVDVVSFCIAPAFFVYTLADSRASLNQWIMLICVFYLIMGIARLAHFNVHGLDQDDDHGKAAAYYTGLPVTYAALIIPATTLIASILAPNFLIELVTLGLLITGILFVLNIKVIKPHGHYYLALIAVAILALYGSYQINIT